MPFFLSALLFFLNSCTPKFVAIKKKGLVQVQVTLHEGKVLIYRTNFLRFDFQTLLPPLSTDSNTQRHVSVYLSKNGKIIAETSASNFFLKLNPNLSNKKEGSHYSAYLFRSLSIKLKASQERFLLHDLDYDTLSFFFVEPVMLGEKYRSNTLQYTKTTINHVIFKNK